EGRREVAPDDGGSGAHRRHPQAVVPPGYEQPEGDETTEPLKDHEADPGPGGEAVVEVAGVSVERDEADHRGRTGEHADRQSTALEVLAKITVARRARVVHGEDRCRVVCER